MFCRERWGKGASKVRKRLVLIALAVAVASVMVFGGPASAGKPGTGTLREAELTGAEVVPGPGDPDGSGMGRFHFYPMKNKICYRVTVSGIQTATKAHLHMGDAGEEGGMVKLNLLPPRNSARECVRDLGERFIKKIAHNSSSYYVDVHNDDFPNGAVRGQLSPSP
jgi:hypothetical protein